MTDVDGHSIRATRDEEATWRFSYDPHKGKELDEPSIKLEPAFDTGRKVDPWYNVRCTCGKRFGSLDEAAEHMDAVWEGRL